MVGEAQNGDSSVRRAFRIIELLAQEEPLGVREIARALSIAPSTSFRIVNEVMDAGFVERMEDGRYTLTPKVLGISSRLLERIHLPSVARPYLEKLAQSAGCTSFLGVPRDGMVVYLLQMQAGVALQLNIDIGTQRPMHATGLGKAMLAFLPSDEVHSILSRPLPKFTERTIVDKDLLWLNLEEIRMRGYSIDDEEILLGIRCIGVPVFDMNRAVVGAISISGPKDKFTEEFIQDFSVKMKSMATVISSRLGFES